MVLQSQSSSSSLRLGHLDPEGHEFSVKLTKQQVKDSPDIDTERPVSRQMESNIYDYYRWGSDWNADFAVDDYYMGVPSSALPIQRSSQRDEEIVAARQSKGDPHLRSIEAVTGYHMHATDGEIGHVEDFLVDDADWSIHYLVVDTTNWWPGKKVLISPKSAREIDWTHGLVNLNVGRQTVKGSPEYDASVMVDLAYEKQFLDHYGDPRSSLP